LNKAFWDRFSGDYTANCLAWTHGEQPILPPSGEGWQSYWTANPDILEFQGRTLLYYRGHGEIPGREKKHDRIGVSEILEIGKGNLELQPLNDGDFVVDVGAADEFDGTNALDPATVEFDGKVFLYYSAVGAGPDQVGLAVSEDGVNFTKYGSVLIGRAPDVVAKDGKIYMIYQREDAAKNYQIYLAASDDGYSFTDIQSEPVFPRTKGSWDSLSIATVRLSFDGSQYYALYGGSAYLADEPDFFGLARSSDLVNWEFHPGNPVFGCGPKGAPDGGAIWFPALFETDDAFVLLYEGSRGKYSWDLSSMICMAWIDK